jgi:hypothetical protein
MSYNLAQYLNRFYQDFGEPDTNRYPIALLKDWLDIGERMVNKVSRCIFTYSEVTSVSNQQEYTLPTDLLDYEIREIHYSTTTSTDREKLLPISIEELDEAYPLWRQTTGVPAYWYINKETGKYGFYPYESTVSTGTNCIMLVYRSKHTRMSRYYSTGTVTMAASTAVVGSGTAWTTNVIAGDKFGIGKLLDSTHTYAFPTTWYTLASTPVSDTALTLTSAFAETTGASQYYIISSPSSIVYDELNEIVIMMALLRAEYKDKKITMNDMLNGEKMLADKARYLRIQIERDQASRTNMTPRGELPIKYERFVNDYSYVGA